MTMGRHTGRAVVLRLPSSAFIISTAASAYVVERILRVTLERPEPWAAAADGMAWVLCLLVYHWDSVIHPNLCKPVLGRIGLVAVVLIPCAIAMSYILEWLSHR
jgi:hypothetical protein